jgi:large subunit ribosomal protein L22
MTGPKRNEGATIAGENTGTRASARYLRSSAYKAREVLDHIRGMDVRSADEFLQLTERDIARDIRKVLASAVANAVHNDELDADDLYVRASPTRARRSSGSVPGPVAVPLASASAPATSP